MVPTVGPDDAPRWSWARPRRLPPSRPKTVRGGQRAARILFGQPAVTARRQTRFMSRTGEDPVPPGLVLSLDEAFRVLEALEDARLAMREIDLAPGLQDELATVIGLIHGRLGFEEGGSL